MMTRRRGWGEDVGNPGGGFARKPAVGTTGPLGDTRSDEALLGAMALGDETAGIAFVRRYQRRVYGLAVAIVEDARIAEDLSQEALVRVWQHSAAYDARRASVATWVLTITRNLCIDALRIRRATPIDPEALLGLGLASSEPEPSDVAERRDAAATVRAAVAALPPEQARALMMAAFYGLTADEISRHESIPLGTAKTRIRAGLAKVRHSLSVGAPEREVTA